MPKITVTVDDETYEKIKQEAEAQDRTIAAQSRRILRSWEPLDIDPIQARLPGSPLPDGMTRPPLARREPYTAPYDPRTTQRWVPPRPSWATDSINDVTHDDGHHTVSQVEGQENLGVQ